MAEPLNEVSALCVGCGLCCNGAIYDRAPLQPGEEADAAAAGFDVFDVEDGSKAFHLPCQHLCGAACTVYEQPRPFVCGDYFCRLAGRLEQGEVAFAEAESRVAAALALIEELRPLLREGETLTAARARWKTIKPGAGLGDDARFAVLMGALNRQLDRFFRYDSQIVMRPSDAGDPVDAA